MSETDTRPIDCKKKNGVYLFEIIKQHDYYKVKTTVDEAMVKNVKIQDSYIGTADSVELECEWYAVIDDTLHLGFGDKGSVLHHYRHR